MRSSAGEHYLHTVGVTGSIPVASTIYKPLLYKGFSFTCYILYLVKKCVGIPIGYQTFIFLPCGLVYSAPYFYPTIKLSFLLLLSANIFDLFVVVVSFSGHLFAYQWPTYLACFVIQAYPSFVSMPSTGCLVCLVVYQSLFTTYNKLSIVIYPVPLLSPSVAGANRMVYI